jgi:hypothetical protein
MRLIDNYSNQDNNMMNEMNENNNSNNIISEEKKNGDNNKKPNGGGDRSTGVIQYADGMTDEEIEANLQSIKASIHSQNKQSEFYVEESVVNQSNVIKSVENWSNKSGAYTKYLSILTLKNYQ